MLGERRKARVLALQALYEIDSVGHDESEVTTRLLQGANLNPENADFAAALVRGVMGQRVTLDAEIQDHAPAWPVAQMSIVDRNILRLALFEIMLDNNIPVKVSINEAVDMAKSYGGDNSYRFVNGVLGAMSARYSQRQEGGRSVRIPESKKTGG